MMKNNKEIKHHYQRCEKETATKTILLSIMTSLLTNVAVMLLLLLMLSQQ